jgi:hypothetical protein
MSASHLKDVKACPCVVCGALKGIDPHHLMRGLPVGERGMSRTAADRYAIPLCRRCHDALHADKRSDDEAWLMERGVAGRDVAAALWARRGERGEMFKVIVRKLNDRRVYVNA